MAVTPVEEAAKIVAESGHALHTRVVRLLRSEGWSVLISPYYSDASAGKAREVDLIAEKAFPVVRDYAGFSVETVNVRLFVECKHIRETTVFWMHAQDRASTKKLVEGAGFRKENTFTAEHHYLSSTGNRVAKLFAGPKARKADMEPEQMFKALSQVLNAMITLRGASAVVPELPRATPVKRRISYPVIVCNDFDRFFFVDVEDVYRPPRELREPFTFEINYAWLNSANHNISEFFLVDVTSENRLSELLQLIESADVRVLGEQLSQ